MEKERFLLLIADSTHFVMKLEKSLQSCHIWCRIIPLPREISAGCGLSIRAEISDLDRIEEILKDSDIKIEKYIVEKLGLKKSFEKL